MNFPHFDAILLQAWRQQRQRFVNGLINIGDHKNRIRRPRKLQKVVHEPFQAIDFL